MPVGKYQTFAECQVAQERKGYSKEVAAKICGKIEKNTKQAKEHKNAK